MRPLLIGLVLFLAGACSSVSGQTHRIVFIGDSVTQYWARDRGAFFANNGFVARGVPAQTTSDILKRFQSDAVDLHPDAVLILAGTNDVAANEGPVTDEQIIDNLKAMSDMAHSASIKVMIGSITPAAKFGWGGVTNPAPRIATLNSKIQAWAGGQGVVYVDYWSALVVPGGGMNPKYSDDGVHPNAVGFGVMEPIALAAIQKTLAAAHDKD